MSYRKIYRKIYLILYDVYDRFMNKYAHKISLCCLRGSLWKKNCEFQTCGSVNLNNICAAKCNDKFKKISFMCAKRWRSYNNHILGCCLWMYTISYQLTVLRTLVLDHMTRLTFHCLQKLRKKLNIKQRLNILTYHLR